MVAKIDKVCVKFSFLTETLTLPHYDGDTKSERVMKNELREKGRGAGRAADGRSRHAVLRRLAGRGGYGAEQSNQIMSGVKRQCLSLLFRHSSSAWALSCMHSSNTIREYSNAFVHRAGLSTLELAPCKLHLTCPN